MQGPRFACAAPAGGTQLPSVAPLEVLLMRKVSRLELNATPQRFGGAAGWTTHPKVELRLTSSGGVTIH